MIEFSLDNKYLKSFLSHSKNVGIQSNWPIAQKGFVLKSCTFAQQCWTEGGPAVFWARGWYFALTGEAYLEEDCIPDTAVRPTVGEKEVNQVNTTQKSIRIYPNPTNSDLVIEFETIDEALSTRIKIVNVLNEIIDFRDIQSGTNQVKLSLTEYQNGTYFCVLEQENKPVGIEKFVILK